MSYKTILVHCDAAPRSRIAWALPPTWHTVTAPILISGRVNEQLRRRAEQSGVSRVLEKPLPDMALVDSIRQALGPAA